MKSLLFTILFLLTHSVFASECATDIAGLRNLVGNSAAPLRWHEVNAKKPLTLNLSNGSGVINLKLTNASGSWADVAGVICKTGADSYVARVSTLTWGPAAPGMAKMARIKEIKLKLPYQSVLKVSVSMFSFEFAPL